MIQDIGEGVFSNAFSLAPAKEDDFLFCYSGGEVLLKDNNGDYELPLCSDFNLKCHHMFSLDGKGCYLSEESIDAPEEVIKPTNDASVFSDLVWIFLNENGIQK